METSLSKYLRKIVEYLTYVFVFVLPWQTKLILRAGETNYTEISLYVSYIFLLVISILFLWFRLREKSDNKINLPVLYSLASLTFFLVISIFFAPDKILAFYHFFVFLAAISLFFIIKLGTEPRNYQEIVINKTSLIYSFLGSILLQSILAIYQFLTQSAFACKYLGLASHNPTTLGTSVIETVNGRWLRAYGGFDHPNILGGVLAISLILAAYLLAKKKIMNKTKQTLSSVFLFIFYFISLYALFFTFSRAAWLSLLIGLVALLVAFIRKKDKWIIGRLIALLFFSLILLGVIAVPFRELIFARVEMSARLEQKSLQERRLYNQESKQIIANNFITGVGIGNYQAASSLIDENKKPAWEYQPVHNVFLLLFSQSGFFSLLSFLIFLVFLIKSNSREKFAWAIFLALLVLMILDHWSLSLPFGVLFLFLNLALI